MNIDWQIDIDGNINFAEVLYYFQVPLSISASTRTLAMVSCYGSRHQELYEQSHQTLWVAQYLGEESLKVVDVKSIRSVVAMVPLVLSTEEASNAAIRAQYSQYYFVAEKPFLDFAGSSDSIDDDNVDDNVE